MKFVILTTKENKKVHVNLLQVTYMEQLEEGTLLHFATNEISVKENVGEILAVCPKEEATKETEEFEAVEKETKETPKANPYHKYKAE